MRFYITTAIDYPNNRPHIGHALEKIGADIQARFRRMEGYAVHFLMGNDENTIKVSQRAEELGVAPKPYVDDMARQFQEVWKALEISNDDFIQTSEDRHHRGCQEFIQKVYDAGRHLQESLQGPVLRRLRGVQDRRRTSSTASAPTTRTGRSASSRRRTTSSASRPSPTACSPTTRPIPSSSSPRAGGTRS